jgi:peptide/nickel transport system substrate-binding protein
MGSQDRQGGKDLKNYLESMKRRNVLAGSAAALTAGLAGCQGDGGGDETTTTTTSGDTTTDGDGMDTTTEGDGDTTTQTTESMGAPQDANWDVSITPRAPPDQIHFNRYNPQQNARGTWAWDSMATSHPGLSDSLFSPVLLDDFNWNSGDLTLRFTLPDTQWWDGTQVDSEDLWTKAMMEAATNRRAHRALASGYEQPDERTLLMKFASSSNPSIIQTQAIFRKMDTPYDQGGGFFGDKADRVWDAYQGSPGEWDTDVLETISSELTTGRISQDQAFGNSLFQHEEYTSQGINCSINEGHWLADQWQGMDGATLHYAPQQDVTVQQFLTGTTEVQNNLPSNLRAEAPESAIRILGPDSLGIGPAWNQEREPWDDINARKAMMEALDRTRVIDNLPNADIWTVDETITGVSATESLYIQDDHFDAFPSYSVEGNQSRADELMSQVDGMSKSGGTWMLNEEALTLEIVQPSGGTREAAGQTVSGLLQDWGIDTNIQVDSETYWGQTFPGSNFDMTVTACMGWRFYPYNGFSEDVAGIGSLNFARNLAYPGADPGDGSFSDRIVGEIDAPPVGSDSMSYPDDYTETYEPPALMKELEGSADQERNKELITEIAWVYATTLPAGPMGYGGSTAWITDDDWNVPEEGTPDRTLPRSQALVGKGSITPKRQ